MNVVLTIAHMGCEKALDAGENLRGKWPDSKQLVYQYFSRGIT